MDRLLASRLQEEAPTQRGERIPSTRRGHQNERNAPTNNADSAGTAGNPLSTARLIRLPAVQQRVGMGRTAVYEMIKAGRFPKPVKLGSASAWIDVEITQWMEQLAAGR